MTIEDNSDLCCDDLLHEIAKGAVNGLLEDSDYDDNPEADIPVSTEGNSSFADMSFSHVMGQTTYVTTPVAPTNNAWSNDCSTLPSARSVSTEGGDVTTVMLRNIPNKYTRSGLLAALVERGFDPTVDCNNLYLPMDAGSGCNLGYAFLNFTSHEKALGFMKQFDGCRLPSAGSRKVCSVVWANKQGLFQHSNPPTVKEQTSPGTGQVQGPEGTPTCKIFVGGLPVTTTEADLVEYFSKFGHVREASIVVNRQTGASRGFGFCEFLSPEAVDRVQLSQASRPHSINCRVVSVRPYNLSQYGTPTGNDNILITASGPTEPQTMTFLMGNGMIHYPTPTAGYSSSYSHPLLAPPSVSAPLTSTYIGQIHQASFMSY
jgi:RNA recognition motif-containing protein